MADYYTILEVTQTATIEEINRAFRRLALKYHPDANPGNKTAENKFKEISEAHEVLGNPDKKSRYDLSRQGSFHFVYAQPQGPPSREPIPKPLTPEGLLLQAQLIGARLPVTGMNPSNQRMVLRLLRELLSSEHISFLIKQNNTQLNRQFISENLASFRYLPYSEIKSFIPKLIRLADSDFGLIFTIKRIQRRLVIADFWTSPSSVLIGIGFGLLMIVLVKLFSYS